MNDNDDMNQASELNDEHASVEGADPDAPAVEPREGEVPPSGILPPDPTGLGALA